MQAEDAAERWLVEKGWTILLRRARTPAGEIDLVATRDRTLTFIEVKARPTGSRAAFAVTTRQQTRIINAAEILLARHQHWSYDAIRFDVITRDGSGHLDLITDAFRQH